MLPSRHDFPTSGRLRARPGDPGSHRGPASSRTGVLARFAALLAVMPALLWSLTGCQEPVPASDPDLTPAPPAIPHARIERDLTALRSGGVLRVLFRYDSSNYFLHKGGQAG